MKLNTEAVLAIGATLGFWAGMLPMDPMLKYGSYAAIMGSCLYNWIYMLQYENPKDANCSCKDGLNEDRQIH